MSDQYQECPNCRATQSPLGGGAIIYRCSCGKVYCFKCSGGGLIDLPRCPVSAYHEGMRKIGSVQA